MIKNFQVVVGNVSGQIHIKPFFAWLWNVTDLKEIWSPEEGPSWKYVTRVLQSKSEFAVYVTNIRRSPVIMRRIGLPTNNKRRCFNRRLLTAIMMPHYLAVVVNLSLVFMLLLESRTSLASESPDRMCCELPEKYRHGPGGANKQRTGKQPGNNNNHAVSSKADPGKITWPGTQWNSTCNVLTSLGSRIEENISIYDPYIDDAWIFISFDDTNEFVQIWIDITSAIYRW